jgi:hypothetical protein
MGDMTGVETWLAEPTNELNSSGLIQLVELDEDDEEDEEEEDDDDDDEEEDEDEGGVQFWSIDSDSFVCEGDRAGGVTELHWCELVSL